MFCVFGISMKECRKQTDKKVNEIFKRGKLEQSEYEGKVSEVANELFEKSKPKPISADLSCPDRVIEFIELAKKDSSLKDLKAMKKIQKLDGSGQPLLTKKTKKPILQWVPMDIQHIESNNDGK